MEIMQANEMYVRNFGIFMKKQFELEASTAIKYYVVYTR
jgi:hypothetical protein